MKAAKATLSIKVYVDCPGCDIMLDLIDPDDTAEVCHNQEGEVISQACPEGSWSEKHSKFEVDGVKCSYCGARFDVRGLEW